MRYVSTTGKYSADLRGAAANCFAPDGSLYIPERIPVIPRALFNNIEEMKMAEIAYVVVTSLLGDDISPTELKRVVDATFRHDFPVKHLAENMEVIELFDGPTMAFKDISAHFMANLMDPAVDVDGKPRVALVATTGNTGAAVANAIAPHKGLHVAVLFPKGALNRRQQAQFTTLGPRVHAIEVAGDISRCKQMVREAMADETLAQSITTSCLNTSNYLRIVPQVVVFFYAYSRLKAKFGADRARGFSPAIPCGNLSSLLSAVIAKRLGLPMGKILAGVSANDDLVRVLAGELAPDKVNSNSRATLAKAMDSGFPTNLRRILALYGNDIVRMGDDMAAFSISDDEIADIIRRYEGAGYVADPHTAVAIGAAERGAGQRMVFATAHPAKSLDTMTAITGRSFELPLQLTRFMTKPEAPVKLPPSYAALRKYLLKIS